MKVFYNEIDRYCCDWLSNLMDAGAITPGVISDRSVEDIVPSELLRYDRVHLFAGIGVWDYAIRHSKLRWYSGVWTASCPCQPFSAAGKGAGFDDERHLWPAAFHLAKVCRPPVFLGEQVASKDGLLWLDLVSSDMEGASYAFGAGDLCAAGFGAPHIRQRLYWSAVGVGDGIGERLEGFARHGYSSARWAIPNRSASAPSDSHALDNRHQSRTDYGIQARREIERFLGPTGRLSDAADSPEERRIARAVERFLSHGDETVRAEFGGSGPTNGFWRDADWLYCRDGKWRPVEPESFPLAYGAPSRVGRLRAYGNAIVAPQAIEWCDSVGSFLEVVQSGI